jgi:hypothetical protein
LRKGNNFNAEIVIDLNIIFFALISAPLLLTHMDKYDARGNQTKININLSFESALTYGD